MARKQGEAGYRLNGHVLTTIIVGNRRYFSCPTMPDIAARFDGCEDATAALDEFERRALASTSERVAPPLCPECGGAGWYVTDCSAEPWLTEACPACRPRVVVEVLTEFNPPVVFFRSVA